METMDTAGLMTAQEAGAYLGRSAHWVQVNRKRGLIPYTALSPRRFAYRKQDLDQWLEQNTVEGVRRTLVSPERRIPKVFQINT
jgi:Helix-turn-helix domain